MTVYKIKRTGNWFTVNDFRAAYEIWGDITESIDDYARLLSESEHVESKEIDENNTWELCAHGFKMMAVIAFKRNMEKNNIHCSIVLARHEVEKIYNVVSNKRA